MSGVSFMERLLDGVEVEWIAFGEVARIQRGASPRPIAKYLTDYENGIPWIKIGDTSSGSKYVNKTAQKITPEGAKKSRILNKGDFILSNSMSFGRPYILDISGAIHDGWASVSNYSEKLNSDYLYHYLSSHNVQNYWLSKINSGSVSNLNADLIKTLLIPIPCPNNPEKSLAIQAEIVRILDTFTELTTELTTELNARKKQYNYYRDQLLSFEEGVSCLSLSQCCESIADGDHQAPQKTENGIPFITISNVSATNQIDFSNTKFVSNSYYDGLNSKRKARLNDILYTVVGSFGIPVHIDNDKKFAFQRHIAILRPNPSIIISKYLYHALHGSDVVKQAHSVATGAAQKTITLTALNRMQIAVPPLAEQARIVAILDKFDTLTTSISEGLPREIELRQKQYEYYRDLLLSFSRPDAEAAA